MSPAPSSKRAGSSNSIAGVKMLVTAASVTAVVGGWASYVIQQAKAYNQESASTDVPDTTDISDESSQVMVQLPPLPTLVPVPSTMPMAAENIPASQIISTSTPVAYPTVIVTPGPGGQSSTNTTTTKKPRNKPVTHTKSSHP